MNRKPVSFLFAILSAVALLFGSGCATVPDAADLPEVFTGRVVSVHAGDSLVMLVGSNRQVRVKLAEIAAPVLTQPYGATSKQALVNKVRGKMVRVTVVGADDIGRAECDVYLDSRWINQEMVAEGAAWHFRKHSTGTGLGAAERAARQKRLGLWAGKQPIPPWEYRNMGSTVPPSEDEHPEPLIHIGL